MTFDYKITDYLFYSKIQCTVQGFPAKVKSVKLIDKKPVVLNKWQRIEYIAPHEKIDNCNAKDKSGLQLSLSLLEK